MRPGKEYRDSLRGGRRDGILVRHRLPKAGRAGYAQMRSMTNRLGTTLSTSSPRGERSQHHI